jgi:hypothetical protein
MSEQTPKSVENPSSSQEAPQSILGFSTHELAGLNVEELANNQTAIKMLLHYYKQLLNQNSALNNEVNTLRTYVDAYQRKKSNSSFGGSLLALSNLLTAFAVNLLTNREIIPGMVLLVPGLIMLVIGLYYSYKDSN